MEFKKEKFIIIGDPICMGYDKLVVKDKKATCYPGIKDDLINAGAVYENAEVVVCDNLVTSRRPDDLPAFTREFVKLLKK